MRKHLRAVTKMLKKKKALDSFELSHTNGNHLEVTYYVGGQRKRLVTSNTPSDHRALKNFEARIDKEIKIETIDGGD